MKQTVEAKGGMDPDEAQAWNLPTAKIDDKTAESDDCRTCPGEVYIRPGQPGRQVGILAEELRVVREVNEAGRQVQQQESSQAIALGEDHYLETGYCPGSRDTCS